MELRETWRSAGEEGGDDPAA